MEAPNIPRGLALLRKQGFKFDIMATSFFLSRRSIRPSPHRRHAALAGQAVHRPRQVRRPTPPTSSNPDRSRGRGRNAGDGLNWLLAYDCEEHPERLKMMLWTAPHPAVR